MEGAIDLDWIQCVLERRPAVLTVHLRTVSGMSRVPAHRDRLQTVVAMRDAFSPQTLMLGNGDLQSLAEARQKVATAEAEGAMIGQFAETSIHEQTPEENMRLLLDHLGNKQAFSHRAHVF